MKRTTGKRRAAVLLTVLLLVVSMFPQAVFAESASGVSYSSDWVKPVVQQDSGDILYANEDLYITGKVPGNGVIDVTPVQVSIEGEKVLAAYDIRIYSNEKQKEKGKTWQPSGKKVQVHIRNEAFAGKKVNVYHLPETNTKAAPVPELVGTVEAEDSGWVTFDAASFSTYAITQSIEKTVSIGGSTYKITVTYGPSTGIPDGAELDVKEVDSSAYLDQASVALGWGQEDEVFYTKFLDISIVYNGSVIEPADEVSVSVELLDVEAGAEALEVVHFGEDGSAVKLNSTADGNGAVTFTTDSFSVFGFGNILRSLLSWSADAVTYTVQGFTRLLNPTYTAVSVAVEEGLQVLSAYNVKSTLGSLLNALYVKVDAALDLGSRESAVLYSVKDGVLDSVLEESADGGEMSAALGSADGFALVLDSGYRRKVFDLGAVELNGMMPKIAQATAEAAEAEGLEGTVLAAYDIHIDENGAPYQPDDAHPVDVSIDVGETEGTLRLWHIRDDGEKEEITDFTVEDGKVRFVAQGFSIYAITDETDNARLGYQFWYNDGTQNVLLATQYFRYKDLHPEAVLSLHEPSIPGMDVSTWTRIFKGWSKSSFHDDAANLLSIQNLNDELAAKREDQFDETVFDIYANFMNVYYITYVDINPNNVLTTEIVPVAESGDTTFTIKPEAELRPGITSDDTLLGWYDINNPDPVYSPGQENVVVTNNMTLYPKVSGGNWLIFNDNDLIWSVEKQAYVSGGASFTPPVFYLDEITVRPADPTWSGYEFGGWYLDADCTEPFDFGNLLSLDTIVYAKWIPSETTYRVVYWKQRPTDDINAADDEKTYDYAGSRLVENAVTGQIVSLADSDKTIYGQNGSSSDADKQYFTYNNNKTDQQIVVKADGSSVMNVYYDRQVITINFTGNLTHYEITTDTTGELYGYIDGEFVRVYSDGNGGYETRTTTSRVETITHHYEGKRYNTTTSNNTTSQQYGVYNNQVIPLYYHDPLFGSSHWSRKEDHSLINDQQYNGTRYVENNNGTYGFVNGSMIRLDSNGNYYTQETVTETTTTPYLGTVYKRVSQNGLTLKGLYGRSMYPGEWPTLNNGHWWQFNSNTGGNVTLNAPWNSYTISPLASQSQINNRTWNLTDSQSSSSDQTIYYYGEDIGGNYSILLAETGRGSGSSLNVNSEKFYGYHTAYWTYGLNGDHHDLNGGSTSISTSYYSSNTPLYIYYDRDKFTITFHNIYTDNGELTEKVIADIPYEKPLSSYADQSYGHKRGYYFSGWFADEGCSEPFDFSQTMPHADVAVFAKWDLRRVRVVIDPGASNVYMGSQATTFRIDFDERIAGGLLENAQRAGYILDGWYTDPEFTNRFLFSEPINDGIPNIDWTYQDDHWRATRIAYGDDDESHSNVRGILHLYAKWIPDLNSKGINVVYDPGDAVVYDSLGNPLTTVPVDPHMYAFDGTATAREAPSNYSDLYTFQYWEATTKDGTIVQFHSGEPINLSLLRPEDIILDDNDEELRHSVVLRAVYELTGDPERQTTITFDGNTFSEIMYDGTEKVMQGKTTDGTQRVTITLDKEVNQTITLLTADDFYMDGWELVGWSFKEGTYAEQEAAAAADPDAPNFLPGVQVAADNLKISDLNDEGNTLYARWQPKEYTVIVRQVVENGVPVHTFDYNYRTGVESGIGNVQNQTRALTDNSSFHVTTLTESNVKLQYYERLGHVMRIQTPVIDENAEYTVRVNAIVTHDDGTTEILSPTAAGDYQILGDVTITYTYSMKVPVTLQKRDTTDHTKVLTDSVFKAVPVEFNSSTDRWETAGAEITIEINQSTVTRKLQEGTYRITEITAPEDYAKLGAELYLTVRKDASFSLFAANGTAISTSVAELSEDSTTHRQIILTIYDNPIRKITLKKQVADEKNTQKAFIFTVTVFDHEGRWAGNYDIGDAGTTNNIGQVSLSLVRDQTIDLLIPHGYQLKVEEASEIMYSAEYQWDSDNPVPGNSTDQKEILANGNLTFINTRKPALTIQKQVTGGWGDKTRYFGFTMKIDGADAGSEFVIVEGTTTSRVHTSETGELSFELKHGEEFTIYLTSGQNVKITETSDTESSRYITTWDNNPANNKETTLTVSQDQIVVVTNNLEPVAPTGYHVTIAPYILLLACGLLLLTLSGKRRAGRKGGGADE